MRYRNWRLLCDAVVWQGYEMTMTRPDTAIVDGPGFSLCVEIPFENAEAEGYCFVRAGTCPPRVMDALGIFEPSLFDPLKERICTTDWEWVPAPLWALAISPLLYWAGIRSDKSSWVQWPAGRSWKPWRRSFWTGRGPWDV